MSFRISHLEVEGRMSVHYDPMHPQYSRALDFMHREVDREAGPVELCAYVAAARMEFGPEVSGIGFVHYVSAADPVPTDNRSAFVVVAPVVNLVA